MQQIMTYVTGNTGVAVSRMAAMLFLSVISVKDVQCRKVSGRMLAGAGILAGISSVVWCREKLILHAAGMMVGVCFLAVSRVTRESLGYGDSLLIGIMGLYLGVFALLEVLCGAWLLTALAAGMILVRKKFQRKVSFPMIPFLTAGYAVMWISEVLQAC